MRGTVAERFESLRPAVLDRLMELRPPFDDDYAHNEGRAREHLDTLLAQVQSQLEGDAELSFRAFVSRWIASSAGEGLPLRQLGRLVLAVGDAIVEVAQAQWPPGDDTDRALRDLVRVNFSTARLVADALADELSRRRP